MKTLPLMMSVAAAALSLSAAPASAAGLVSAGTLNFVGNDSPTVTLTTAPNTYTVTNLGTLDFSGKGGFAATGTGVLNGTLNFSSVVGGTVTEAPNDFFVFSDGSGGSYDFSVATATTQNYAVSPASSAIALYLLGTTTDASKSLAATPTSVTLQFNATGTSAFSTSGSLAIPPSISAAPEPGAWALLLGGLGGVGLILRLAKARRRGEDTLSAA